MTDHFLNEILNLQDKIGELERKSAKNGLEMAEAKKEFVEMRRIIENAQRQNEQRNKDIKEVVNKRIHDASFFLLSFHQQ